MDAYLPRTGSTQTVTPGAASATVTIATPDPNVRLLNTGANICYVRTFSSTQGAQSATVADHAIAPGQSSTISKDPQHDRLAHISPAGTTLVISTGEGI